MDAFSLVAKLAIDSSAYDNGVKKARSLNSSLKSDVQKLAEEYVRQGDNMADAMKKAASSISQSIGSMATQAVESSGEVASANSGFLDSMESVLDGFLGAAGTAAAVAIKAVASVSKAVVEAVEVAAEATAKLTKSAIDGYAKYEQLSGGVEKLFGKDAKYLEANAAEAYKTSGLSANEYMEQVTSFASTLIDSLGGQTGRAVEVADVAMRAMSDNVSTFGSDMASVQNAFQGFSKQNYTLLDNLKLGYGGTKQEMERLIKDANTYAASIGKSADLSIDSFADVVQAIELIQEKQGIAGSTAKESFSTIEGSVTALKKAWENVLTGIADGSQDMGELVGNLTETAESAVKNIVPRIEESLNGIGELVKNLAPVIAEELPKLAKDVVPGLIDAVESLIDTVADVLGDEDTIGPILDAAVDIVIALAEGIADNLDTIVEAAGDLLLALIDTLTDPETLKDLVIVAGKLVIALAKGLIEAVAYLLVAVAKLLANLIEAIAKFGGKLFKAGADIIKRIADGVSDGIRRAVQWGHDLIDNFVRGIKERVQKVVDAIKGIGQSIKNFLGFSEPKLGPLSNFHTYAPDMIDMFVKGMKDNEYKIDDQIGRSFDLSGKVRGPRMGAARWSNGYASAYGANTNASLATTINLDSRVLWRGMLPTVKRDASVRGMSFVTR